MRVPTLDVLTGLTVVLVLAPAPAFAYIDPGTGSFLFQAIAAAVIGGAFAARQFWGRIREGLRRLFGPRRAG